MRTHLLIVAVVCAGCLAAAASADAASCESLSSLSLPNTTVTLAQTVAPGTFAMPAAPGPRRGAPPEIPNLPGFCRVAARLSPSTDSDIRIEVWMPTAGWNGKFLAVGNGGFAGAIAYPPMAQVLRRGYAVASTNTGHDSNVFDASWAMGHPEKQIDFGYRAVHEMTLRAKSIVAAFYDTAPRYSYWNGCSSGGKQGLKEAQRFPEDYDGIIAGAPANYWTHLMSSFMAVAQGVRRDATTEIPQSKYGLIHDAVMAKCDALDGVKDGLLEDPRRCQFDPASLQCEGPDAPTCLTPPQAASVKQVYAAVKSPRTGREIYPGLPAGSERGWGIVPQPFAIGENHFKYVVFGNPNWDYKSFDVDRDLAKAVEIDAAIGQFTANDPDLSAFKKRGGKLLQYHGWNDQQISAQNSVNYYTRVVSHFGKASDVDGFYRLFMVPGMMHCGGGAGATDRFDAIAAIERWVEQGAAPDRLIASQMVNGAVARTRPICPYPQVATWKGSGNTDSAENFVCAIR